MKKIGPGTLTNNPFGFFTINSKVKIITLEVLEAAKEAAMYLLVGKEKSSILKPLTF